ncbi:hypothetical protein DOZ80_11250 [Pseudomonas fluorescens]|uniref:Uncharacterized protein n=1 Tax=Pseudomonas fluorescens TaxID=294 RepID=A0A327N9X3_PSEFL|nr:hypothetical protein DOZ80_11250 [Pseudomonas fluorescens]
MDVNDDACFLDKRGALKSIASELAPTDRQHCAKKLPRLPVSLRQGCLHDLDVYLSRHADSDSCRDAPAGRRLQLSR